MANTTVRRATHDDYEDVVAFTEDTWSDREQGDYLPRVFHDWVERESRSDGEQSSADETGPGDDDQRTVVVEVDGDVVGVCQGKLLSGHEAWLRGMRVAPDHRGAGHGMCMIGDLFEWASERGATVARNLVFGWNDAGLGQSVAAGFDPRASFRWARPEPRDATPEERVDDDPAAAWSYWARSDGRDALGGLALDREEAWTLSELTRDDVTALADDERVFAVKGDGTRGMAARARTVERSTGADGATGRAAVYGVGAWADAEAAEALFAAVRADADDLSVDAMRVLIPESPRHVAEAAAVRADPDDGSEFVFEADLTGVT